MHAAGRRVGRLDERRFAGDGDGLFERADLERDVEADEGLRADRNALALERLVTLHRRFDPVGDPGSTAGNEYSPTPLVTVSRDTPLASLTSVTVTPGMTPCASLTMPRRPPCDDWARRCVGLAVRRTAASREHSAVESVRIIIPPFMS